jgi:hypothetical protein
LLMSKSANPNVANKSVRKVAPSTKHKRYAST